MKLFLIIFTITLSLNLDWVDNLNATINKINKEAILKKENSEIKVNVQSYVRQYKLIDFEKVEFLEIKEHSETMNLQLFSKGNLLFAYSDFIVMDYFHKGAENPEKAKGKITESRKYYKKEKEGVLFRRSIEYYENNNIDSMKLELQKMQFDTTYLDKEDYTKDKLVLTRIKRIF